MEELRLDWNSLSGTIDVGRLPASMHTLSLGNNNFSGSTDFGKLPTSLGYLNVQDTQLAGEIPMYWNLTVRIDGSKDTSCGNTVRRQPHS
eukprot:CAMPEP_0201542686 /NCGR_PEP_ID=MMETSP0161_2-20130828/72171_1 /ASSEMBLY_ACC=CAM_ASM_000251 /TAXON_ID=180227 /ORGANISM="Neoparamoeba aestuarina, Strain SoJaBio B1-5/56/2" /LENGTH=89 /DNA_ID=CAMNT_0047950361 /DNA_START=423 /DNA_END=692 /DNA_ORIENTATION=+